MRALVVDTVARHGGIDMSGPLDKAMIKRIGQPEDVAWCALYLASEEAGWVTAADIAVNGGATAW